MKHKRWCPASISIDGECNCRADSEEVLTVLGEYCAENMINIESVQKCDQQWFYRGFDFYRERYAGNIDESLSVQYKSAIEQKYHAEFVALRNERDIIARQRNALLAVVVDLVEKAAQ